MAEFTIPGVESITFAEGGRTYRYTFPVTTSDPEVIDRLKRQGAVKAPKRPPSAYFKPSKEVKADDASTA